MPRRDSSKQQARQTYFSGGKEEANSRNYLKGEERERDELNELSNNLDRW